MVTSVCPFKSSKGSRNRFWVRTLSASETEQYSCSSAMSPYLKTFQNVPAGQAHLVEIRFIAGLIVAFSADRTRGRRRLRNRGVARLSSSEASATDTVR